MLPLDDLRLAILETVPASASPAVHRFSHEPHLWRRSAAVTDGFIAVAQEVEMPLSMIVAQALASPDATPVIMEGDFISPRLMASPYTLALARFQGVSHSKRVYGLLLHEQTESEIRRAVVARGRTIEVESAERLETNVRASWSYGNWLRREAERYGVPVLASRPHTSLLERALETITRTA